MINDNKSLFSDSQAITATADSTNKVNVPAFMGKNRVGGVFINVKVVEDFATLTSLDIDLQQSATESGSYTSVQKISAIPLASLKKGYKAGFRVPPALLKSPWLKLVYTVNGSNATAGKVFASINCGEEVKMEAGLYINAGKVIA